MIPGLVGRGRDSCYTSYPYSLSRAQIALPVSGKESDDLGVESIRLDHSSLSVARRRLSRGKDYFCSFLDERASTAKQSLQQNPFISFFIFLYPIPPESHDRSYMSDPRVANLSSVHQSPMLQRAPALIWGEKDTVFILYRTVNPLPSLPSPIPPMPHSSKCLRRIRVRLPVPLPQFIPSGPPRNVNQGCAASAPFPL